MVNTVTQRTLIGAGESQRVVRLINLVSDGTEETDLVVYDNSTLINNVAKGRLMKVSSSGSSCVVRLEWDQSTDSPCCSFDPSQSQVLDFKEFGGISNPAGSGATGDLVMSSSSLDSGDEITLIIEIEQS